MKDEQDGAIGRLTAYKRYKKVMTVPSDTKTQKQMPARLYKCPYEGN